MIWVQHGRDLWVAGDDKARIKRMYARGQPDRYLVYVGKEYLGADGNIEAAKARAQHLIRSPRAGGG